MDQYKIGRFIAENRKKKNLTQEMLGEKIGVTNKTVSRWETGKYMPDLDTIPPLCEELGISVNELLSGTYLKDDCHKQADENIMDVFAANKKIRRQRQISDILTGAGTGIILGVIYAPDTAEKTVCVVAGLLFLCVGWFIRIEVERSMIGK